MQEPRWIHLEHEGRGEVLAVSPGRQNQTDDVTVVEQDMLANLQPQLWNSSAGMKETCFKVLSNENCMGARRLLVQLACDHSLTPWCVSKEGS